MRTPNLRKNEEPEEAAGGNEWQTTYMDTVTILLTFFIIMSSSSAGQQMKIFGERGSPLKGDKEVPKEEIVLFFPVRTLERDMKKQLQNEIDSGVVQLERFDYEVRLSFTGSTFFNSGEAELLPGGKDIISRIVSETANIDRKDFKIDVEGHTDSNPIKTLQFKSNWELSAARAANVVRYFLNAGVPAKKLKASGYADTFPLVKERDAAGKPIPSNQAKNRRIVIRLYFD